MVVKTTMPAMIHNAAPNSIPAARIAAAAATMVERTGHLPPEFGGGGDVTAFSSQSTQPTRQPRPTRSKSPTRQ